MVIFIKSGLYGAIRNELEYKLTANAIVVLFLLAEIIHTLTAGGTPAVMSTAIALGAIVAVRVLLQMKRWNLVGVLAGLLISYGVAQTGLALYNHRAYETICALIPLGWVVGRMMHVSLYLKAPRERASVS